MNRLQEIFKGFAHTHYDNFDYFKLFITNTDCISVVVESLDEDRYNVKVRLSWLKPDNHIAVEYLDNFTDTLDNISVARILKLVGEKTAGIRCQSVTKVILRDFRNHSSVSIDEKPAEFAESVYNKVAQLFKDVEYQRPLEYSFGNFLTNAYICIDMGGIVNLVLSIGHIYFSASILYDTRESMYMNSPRVTDWDTLVSKVKNLSDDFLKAVDYNGKVEALSAKKAVEGLSVLWNPISSENSKEK